MKKLFLILFIFTSAFTFAQNVDSLLTLIKTAKPDTNKINHLNNLSREYRNIGEFDKALKYSNDALTLGFKISFKKGIAQSYNNIGNLYFNQGNYPEALINFLASLKIFEELKDKKGIASSYNNIGIIYDYQGNNPEAIKNLFASLKIKEELNDKRGIAASYNNIGNIYNSQGNYSSALKNHFASLKIFEELKDKKGIAASHNNIGNIYEYQGNYPEALKNYFASLKISEEIKAKKNIASIYNNIGNIYYNQGNYTEALKNQFASLKISEQMGDKNYIATTYGNIGNVKTKLKEYDAAIKYLNAGLALSKEMGAKDLIRNNHQSFSTLDSALGNHKAALEHYKMYIIYRDSFDNEETQKKTIQSQMTYDFEKKELATKAEQDKKDAIALEEKQKQQIITWSIGFGLFLVMLFALFVFRSLKTTRKQKQIIEIKSIETESQKLLIESKHKEITDSINYAERIQRSFLATKEHLNENLKEYFLFFKPKDVVSGDFYWSATLTNGMFALVTADSTGHGVPGAIMSLLNISGLEKAIETNTEPAAILNSTRKTIIERLKKDGSAEGGKDGMDASLCVYDFKNKKLKVAAANNPVWIMRGTEVIEIKPDKMPIGKHDRDTVSFTQQEIDLQTGDVVYTLTDGFPDQFGGENGKKFMIKKLREFIASIAQLPLAEQKQLLENTFTNWVGNMEQVDDVCIIGVRV